MKLFAYLIITATLMTLSTGCASRIGQLTAASTQNVRNLDYSVTDKTKQHTKGYSCVSNILFVPFGSEDDRLQRAIDDAIAKGHEKGLDGDLLVNVRIDQSTFSLVVIGQDCIVVEGDLVALKK